jgi:hypothetical protein
MTNKKVLEIISAALRAYQDERVNDVTREKDGDTDQLVLTMEGDEGLQVFVLDSDALRETEPPADF